MPGFCNVLSNEHWLMVRAEIVEIDDAVLKCKSSLGRGPVLKFPLLCCSR